MKLILWVLEHFPSLAAWGFGIFEVTQHKPELAMLFFVMAALFEIAGAVSDVRRDVKALRESHVHSAACHPSADGCPDRPGM